MTKQEMLAIVKNVLLAIGHLLISCRDCARGRKTSPYIYIITYFSQISSPSVQFILRICNNISCKTDNCGNIFYAIMVS